MQRLLLSLLILCCLTLTAQTDSFQPREFENALMFRISGNGLDKPSYLFGSLHSIPHEFVTQNERFMQIVSDVERITVEADYERILLRTDSISTFSKLTFPEMRDVLAVPADSQMNVIAPEQFHFVDSLVQRYNIKMIDTEEEPWWHYHVLLGIIGNPLMVTIPPYLTIAREALGLPGNHTGRAIDHQMQPLASSLGKQIGQLESVESQLKFFPVLNLDVKNFKADEAMREMFRTSIARLGTVENHAYILYHFFKTIEGQLEDARLQTQQYLNQDAHATLQVIREQAKGYQINNDFNSKERNEAWMPVIQEQMTSAPTLFVVGIAHLFDADDYAGLLHFLQDAGYTIEPIRL